MVHSGAGDLGLQWWRLGVARVGCATGSGGEGGREWGGKGSLGVQWGAVVEVCKWSSGDLGVKRRPLGVVLLGGNDEDLQLHW